MSGTSIEAPVDSPEGIWANVTMDITLTPYAEKADHVVAAVAISATNKTKVSIKLKDPYRLPARRIQNVTSDLDNGESLQATKTKDGIYVFFGDRTLQADKMISWNVKYTRTQELYLNHILAYDLFIDPQRTFQDVVVRNHRFNLRVTILNPDDASWRPLRRWHLHQRNYPLNVNPKIDYSWERTIYDFGSFDLVDETFDLRIAAVYGFRNWIAHAFHLAVGAAMAVLLEHGPALVMKILSLS